ncbi:MULTISPECIES: bifunctional 5,10-methylenetetrahydrofolate dehydrogenase/5,10-methenyltetrahydrofolate cyclohydrolase [Streptomyces]|nr:MULTISPECIES: bifunctional 5,10-methylenetetrahydrofolate dehydrogenase/5,10-methenyltetrahydrofolate cyclohydrolase [Streptomyces]
MSLPATRRLSGTALLGSVRESLSHYRQSVESTGRRATIIRFSASDDDSPSWKLRMEASRVSAEQKVKAFSHLGYEVDHQVLAPTVSDAQFSDRLHRLNEDPLTSAVIVQFPPPPHLAPLVQHLTPAKDIDGLLEDRSLQPACATADGITRLVAPFASDNPTIAVVGARGFVGGGVVRLLAAQGHQVQELDAGDDLRALREADIVVSATGQPHLLTREHIHPHHRVVVDSGFMPRPDGTVAGDIHPSATTVPQCITPVPGGVGPVEMAVLMERVVRQDVDPGLKSWASPPVPYLTQSQVAAVSTSVPAQGVGQRVAPAAPPAQGLRLPQPAPRQGQSGRSV